LVVGRPAFAHDRIDLRPPNSFDQSTLGQFAGIAHRDLWRRPHDRAYPEPWDLEVWIRSEFGRHLFSLKQGHIIVQC
jgi:hypothetical protein